MPGFSLSELGASRVKDPVSRPVPHTIPIKNIHMPLGIITDQPLATNRETADAFAFRNAGLLQ